MVTLLRHCHIMSSPLSPCLTGYLSCSALDPDTGTNELCLPSLFAMQVFDHHDPPIRLKTGTT